MDTLWIFTDVCAALDGARCMTRMATSLLSTPSASRFRMCGPTLSHTRTTSTFVASHTASRSLAAGSVTCQTCQTCPKNELCADDLCGRSEFDGLSLVVPNKGCRLIASSGDLHSALSSLIDVVGTAVPTALPTLAPLPELLPVAVRLVVRQTR